MRAHYFQHVPFEGLGSIEHWLETTGFKITRTQFFQPHTLPVVQEIDLLVIMGGPMSVNDEAAYPWLVAEKACIREVIETGRPVLGICLGAQLIASAMGARVYANPQKEIGWFPIEAVASQDESQFSFPASMEVFHWHGETFDLPVGSTLLAQSDACKHQAFQLGSSVIGLQFHLETTVESARQILTHCREELIPAEYIQTEQSILTTSNERYGAINRYMEEVLAYLRRNID